MNLQRALQRVARPGVASQRAIKAWRDSDHPDVALTIASNVYGPAAIRLLDQVVKADVLPARFQKKAAGIVNKVVALATPRKHKCSRA